ncbi:MAG TPA: IS256 family transposase [Burkholderiales bacterium]|nr:IS256 family transposase [Burkholderiales bacterium]
MSKSAKSKGRREGASEGQLWLRLPGVVRDALYDTVIEAGLACVDEVLCGTRYKHLSDRQALRAGHVASSLVLGGRRVGVSRPRVRSVDGRELKLSSWREWSARDPLDERALEQMVLGVSTRRYARSLEPLPEGVAVRGVSKSAVSERFVYGTERKLAELMSRELSGLGVVALLIDGVHFGEHVVLAAVGVDERGAKHVLGLREGATENAAAAKALLADLVERGLNPNRALLVVIDGAKALHKAVVEVFGAFALIQRCREHKKRNVTEALPERMRAAVRLAMNQAYATRDARRARRLLDNLARRLEHQHPGAAASLREGLEETLTVMRLELPENLERVLSSTNLIENLFSRVRELGRRVKRWQSGTMVLRWTAAGVLEAEHGFRKLAGYRAMPTLVAALRAHHNRIDREPRIDDAEKAA